jgi:DegV family protein with EDD domain
MIRIVTDSSSDISPRLATELGVTVVPIRINLGAKVYHDGVDIDRNDFYRHLTKTGVSPTVMPPLLAEFSSVYTRLLKDTDQILAIHISSRLSRTAQVARDAAKAFLGRNKITVIDSRMISWGLGLLVTVAAEAARRGESVEEIVRLIRGVIPHVYMVFFAENLAYWQRYGRRRRVGTSAETLPGYRPLLIVEDGEIVPLERVRSRGRSVDRLYEFLVEFAHFERATVLHGRLADDGQVLFEQLIEAFPEKRLDIQPYGPVLATHLGPGAFGVGVYEGLQ